MARLERAFATGDIVAIKGVRSRTNGRRRATGVVIYVNHSTRAAVVRDGAVDYHVGWSSLVIVRKANPHEWSEEYTCRDCGKPLVPSNDGYGTCSGLCPDCGSIA
jgi:predicted RNA-binding Zn-ribbon protein involved in translation (DUF1610 family)